jgi:hypothetical protein
MEATINQVVAKVAEPIANRLANYTFNNAKAKMIREIQVHEISKELDNPKTNSKFIKGGSHPDKSLYGFFGFDDGVEPAKELVSLIDQEYYIEPRGIFDGRQYSYGFRYLSLPELEKATPLSWSSRSWLKAVENGLANISKFISRDTKPIGRSSYGIQIKNELKNPGQYTPTQYMTPIFKEFMATLKSAKLSGAIASADDGKRYYNIRNAGGRFTK